MSLFGETCVRCGTKRTRSEFEGLPTCEHCELEIRADREEKRLCPVDGTAMTKVVVHNVIVDRCPECDGLWLDGDELGLLKRSLVVLESTAADADSQALIQGLLSGM